jgi:hypothetical protein
VAPARIRHRVLSFSAIAIMLATVPAGGVPAAASFAPDGSFCMADANNPSGASSYYCTPIDGEGQTLGTAPSGAVAVAALALVPSSKAGRAGCKESKGGSVPDYKVGRTVIPLPLSTRRKVDVVLTYRANGVDVTIVEGKASLSLGAHDLFDAAYEMPGTDVVALEFSKVPCGSTAKSTTWTVLDLEGAFSKASAVVAPTATASDPSEDSFRPLVGHGIVWAPSRRQLLALAEFPLRDASNVYASALEAARGGVVLNAGKATCANYNPLDRVVVTARESGVAVGVTVCGFCYDDFGSPYGDELQFQRVRAEWRLVSVGSLSKTCEHP